MKTRLSRIFSKEKYEQDASQVKNDENFIEFIEFEK